MNKLHKFATRRSCKYVAILLCFIIALGGRNIVYHMEKDVVTYISIDVNPSIELALNKFDQVVPVKAYNDDGRIVLDNVKIEGKNYEDVINIIVESESLMGYLTENAALTFTVASESKNKESEIVEKISNCESCKKHKGTSTEADIDMISEAHDSGLSFGKYMAYLELKKYNDSFTTDDCKNMTMREIRDLINKYSGNNDYNGNCYGNKNKGVGKENCNGSEITESPNH